MELIGLTGGIGSGKSQVGRMLANRGIPVIDADQVGHEVIAPGGAAEKDVRERFGDNILTCGKIDRDKLAARVFQDKEALADLNALVHPAIMAEVGRRCQEHAQAGKASIVIEAALLGEHGGRDAWLSRLVLVSCPETLRMERLITERGMSPEKARERIGAQRDPESKRPLADWIVDNSGSLEALEQEVDRVAAWLS